jgi:hypothetical protein
MDHLAQTVEVRAFATDEELNGAMQEKLEAIYAELLTAPAVANAYEACEAAKENVAKLKRAQSNLTQRARAVFDKMKEVASACDMALIESQSALAEMKSLAALEAEHRAVSRANSRVLEHLLPQAEIAELNRTADYLTAKAYAVRDAASQRIQRTAQMMAEAAEYEGGIVFDSLNTLSGEMQRQAAEFDRQAANYRTWARDREEQYLKLAKELESISSVRMS